MRKSIFILLLINALNLLAQENYKFRRFTTEDGLPGSYGLCIAQDKYGFMWFGTRGGCCRFDGFEFKSFPIFFPERSEKCDIHVSKIVNDGKGRLWIVGAGKNCLLKFDYNNEVFIDYSDRIKKKVKTNRLNIVSFYIDKEDKLWIGTSIYGLIIYNPDDNSVKRLENNPNNKNSILSGACISLISDSNSNVWILMKQGLSCYNLKNKRFTHYFEQTDTKPNENLSCVAKDLDQNIWVSHKKLGISKYNPEIDNFGKFKKIIDNNNVEAFDIGALRADNQNRLWIGTSNGLFVSDKQKENFKRYVYDDLNSKSINSNIIRYIFRDNENEMWIATSEGFAQRNVQDFSAYRFSPRKNSIRQNKVQYIIETENNDIWISTPAGIDIFNRETNSFRALSGIPQFNKNGLFSPIVFHEEPNKGMWIGTYRGGLIFYDYNNRKTKIFYSDKDKLSTLSNNNVFDIFTDSQGRMWIATSGGGLNLYNEKSGKFIRFMRTAFLSSSIPSNHIFRVFEDSKKRILISTDNGISVLDNIEKKEFSAFINSKTLGTTKNLIANDIIETRNNKYLWIATNIGLLRYKHQNEEISWYTEKRGLPSNYIASIIDDNSGKLWLGTNRGLVEMQPVYEKDTIICNTYSKSDGLQGSEFLPASRCKLRDGTLIFGGLKGFSLFNPDSIRTYTGFPKLLLTGLEMANIPVNIGEEINNQVVLDKSITNKKQLIINHNNNDFSIQFIGLNYKNQHKIKYTYKLDGFDKKWHFTNASNRQATYMNLENGDYIFLLKASNSLGEWSDTNKLALKIKILPPWWKLWWVTCLWVSVLILSTVLIIRGRIDRLKKQKLKLENIVQKRTSELQAMNSILEEQKKELEIQANKMSNLNKQLNKTNTDLSKKTTEIKELAKKMHDTDQSKLIFFSNLSHEFRTPLSLILAPLEKLKKLKDWNKDTIKEYHKLMHKNARKLLRLTNQIIDFRKFDMEALKISATNNNIEEFVKEVAEVFKIQAETKNIQLRVKSEEPGVRSEEFGVENEEQQTQSAKLITHHSSLITHFWFDPDIMEKILYNLISNAIKYTPEGGEIIIQLRVKNEEIRVENTENQNGKPLLFTRHSSLFIEIKDTGIGIKPENIDKIFDRFYRADNIESKSTKGTGIGLAYTKELVELHNGTITVQSQKNKGSVFTLSFTINDSNKKNPQEKSSEIKLDYINSMIDDDIEDHPDSVTNTRQLSVTIDNHINTSVLIAEDNSDLRTIIKGELENSYNVYEAGNGEQALKLATQFCPDLIISDIMMPVMDGIELCEKIKTNEVTSHIPVILLTAKAGEQNTITGFETGADDYITKPFKFSLLLARIDGIIKTRKLLQEKFSKSPLENAHKVSVTNKTDEEFLKRATKIVEKNLDNDEFNNNLFVKLMGMSRTLFYRKIKALTNQSVSEFIRTIRLKIAANLLLDDSKNITEVAWSVGFKHRENFTKYFSLLYGKTPSEYIKQHVDKNTTD